MNRHSGKLINVIATGLIVLVLFSLVLFWCRFFFWSSIIKDMPENFSRLVISPSGLVPGEPAPQQVEPQNQSATLPPGPNEPNFRYSQVYAGRNKGIVVGSAIGALWDIMAKMYPFRDANERVYYWYGGGDTRSYICLDNRAGLIIRHYKYFEANDVSARGEMELFAGPNGISETASASLGRFYEPVMTEGWDPNFIGLYDKKTRRFYVIDFAESSVTKGFQLAQADSREPISNYSVAGIEKWPQSMSLSVTWDAPMVWSVEEGKWKEQRLLLGDGNQSGEGCRYIRKDLSHTFIPVLDKAGRIYIYNSKEQTLTSAGYLPRPVSLFSAGNDFEAANPRDVLAYGVWPIFAVQRLPAEPNKPQNSFDAKYLGMNAACVLREGTAIAVAVFDANGKQVYRGDTKG